MAGRPRTTDTEPSPARDTPKAKARDRRGQKSASSLKVERGKGSGEKYSKRVAAYKAEHKLWSTEDVQYACQMELEIIGDDRTLAGTRMVYNRLILDCRKQIFIEQGGEDNTRIVCEHRYPGADAGAAPLASLVSSASDATPLPDTEPPSKA